MLSVREYKGLWTVEYNSKSLGCTIFSSWDKKQAEDEYQKFKDMTEDQLKNWLIVKY